MRRTFEILISVALIGLSGHELAAAINSADRGLAVAWGIAFGFVLTGLFIDLKD